MIDFILEFFISFFTYKADAIYAVDPGTAALVLGGLNFLSSRRQSAQMRSSQRQMDALTQQQLKEAREFRDEQLKLLAVEKEKYREMVFVNPFEDLENPFEDLTVNTLEAEFMSRRGEQTRANILSSLRSAAGSSGIAALAQTLANQGMLQTQKIAANIGKQEAINQRAAAQGALTADMAERKGEAGVQTLEAQRQANLLSMQAAVSASAASNLGQAQANQMSALVAGNQLQAQMAANQMNALNQLGQTYLLTQTA
tara:strand:+ start:1646 stop:2413 length:768 start_codon:yes stop_codon:yes gene_type:complete